MFMEITRSKEAISKIIIELNSFPAILCRSTHKSTRTQCNFNEFLIFALQTTIFCIITPELTVLVIPRLKSRVFYLNLVSHNKSKHPSTWKYAMQHSHLRLLISMFVKILDLECLQFLNITWIESKLFHTVFRMID